MTTEKFRELLHSNPFVPFTILLADSHRIPVQHPDFVSSSQSGRIVHVFHGPNAASTFVDVMLVTGLEVNPGAAPASQAN